MGKVEYIEEKKWKTSNVEQPSFQKCTFLTFSPLFCYFLLKTYICRNIWRCSPPSKVNLDFPCCPPVNICISSCSRFESSAPKQWWCWQPVSLNPLTVTMCKVRFLWASLHSFTHALARTLAACNLFHEWTDFETTNGTSFRLF